MRGGRVEIDSRDLLRESAALLLAVGAALWVERTGAAAGAFLSFLILAVPASVLTWLAFTPGGRVSSVPPWRAVQVTVATVLWVLALRQLANWLGDPGDADNGVNVFWTFALVSVFAAYAARRLGVRFLLLAASLLSALALAGLLNALLDEGIESNFGAFRAVMFVYALLLAGAGVRLWRSGVSSGPSVASELDQRNDHRALRDGAELLTAASLVAVVISGYGLTSALGLIPTLADVGTAGSNLFWELLLLAVGISSVVAGVGIGSRGLAWVGAVGLAIFFWLIAADVHSVERRPDAFGVWPAVLLGVGLVFLVASLVPQSSIRRAFRTSGRRVRSRSDRSR